jgi:ABC-type branched-subunit amino acid transport system substrate-binding protein
MRVRSVLVSTGFTLAVGLSMVAWGAGSPLKVAILGPLSGQYAYVGNWMVDGVKAGVNEVNTNGGVMGHQLTTIEHDTAGDPVDAVPAWNRLYSQHPTFEIGPTALTAEAIIARYDSAKLPSFTVAGSDILDHMSYKYVFRTVPGDSTMAAAMGAYAIDQHLTHALIIFSSGVSSQTLIPPLKSGYLAHGGQIVGTVSITPGQTSYLSALQKAFNGPVQPDCIFMQLDPNTSATVFKNLQELDHLNIPIIDTDNGTNPEIAKSMGFAKASQLLTGMTPTAPSGASFQEFLKSYQQVFNTTNYHTFTPAIYDSVIIASLAMDAAKSTDPSVWVSDVTTVSNPPGVACSTYAECVADLNAGKQIDYQGASGPEDFNQYHNVFAGWTVDKWTTAGKLEPAYKVPAATISSYAK